MSFNKKQYTALILVIAVFAAVILINTYGKKVLDDKQKITNLIAKENWVERPLGDTGLSLITPDSMKQIQIKLDDNAKKTIESYDAFEYTVGTFFMKVNKITAKYDLSAEDYTTRLADMIQNSGDFPNYEYGIENDSANHSSMLRGVSDNGTSKNAVDALVIVSDTVLWEVTISYDPDSKKQAEIADRVFSSAKIQ
jgi:hypothetical protein